MRTLSDAGLIEAYRCAVQLNLDSQFIDLLMEEITARGLSCEEPEAVLHSPERIRA